MKGAGVKDQPKASDPLGDATLDFSGRGRAAGDPKPHHARRTDWRKHAEPAKHHRERLDVDRLPHGLDDILDAPIRDLAEKRQRQVHASGCDPLERES